MNISSEEAEPWTGAQRALPAVAGLLWVIVGALVVGMGVAKTEQWWVFACWGSFIVLAGLFALYLRFRVLPTVRA